MLGSARTRVFVAAAVLLAALGLPAVWPEPAVPRARYDGTDAGPAEARSLYWVGHSLMSSRDEHAPGSLNVIETVDALAAAAGLGHASFDHTLWGSPLSLAYLGRSHAGRLEPELPRRLERLRSGQFDTLVLVDTVPIDAARRYEHTAYYAAQLACEARARVPEARVYLFEGWVGLQGLDQAADEPHRWDWPERLARERAGYEAVADELAAGAIVEPGLLGRWTRWLGPPCEPGIVFLVPVATAFRSLARALRSARWTRADGSALALTDFFANPYLGWPDRWPDPDADATRARGLVASLGTPHPEPADDVHTSALGSHFVGLVNYAALYRRSPEGLPLRTAELSEDSARRLQRLAWEVVRSDPRSGVGPRAAPGD
jgi:hypothetical protein